MRYLGIDYGTKRVGLALSDESGTLAFPHVVIQNDDTLLEQLAAICADKEVVEIVIGHSKDNAGNDNPVQAAITELVTDLTLRVGVPVHLEPEQFSTQAAARIQGKHAAIDASAAALILDSYLHRNS